jgi:flagellar biosynthesis anti-sigma factor FlgM
MPDISSIGHGPLEPVNRTSTTSSFRENGAPQNHRTDGPQADRVELSDRARFLDRLRQFPEVRMDRIERVRQAIAEGTYETEEKLEVAIDRLVEELIE